jgi:molybdopterin/thiamine biosynthesis adenylyltransferase
MDIWFLRNMERLARERQALRALEDASDWLVGTDWLIEGSTLCLEAIIRAGGHDYPVRLVYPPLFPAIPPVVHPKNPDERWSGHQYADGTLCLEWGPDTWHPEVTGAQVLESAYRLLSIENPLGDEHDVAPSRHQLSLGQSLRGKFGRVYVGSDLIGYLRSLPPHTQGSLDISIQWQSQSLLTLIQSIHPVGQEAWEDHSIPQGVRASKETETLKAGILYTTDLAGESLTGISVLQDIDDTLGQGGFAAVDRNGEQASHLPEINVFPSVVLLLDAARVPHVFLIFSPDKKGTVVRLNHVLASADDAAPRFPIDSQDLADKRVGIVGLGSVGSKMVLSLARAGVSRFFLVDEDVFLPENVGRHVLDWKNIGEHKVDAVRAMLSRIAPGIEVDVSRLSLTGQESTAALSSVLGRLAACDLMIDATADPKVFNLMASLAVTYAKPLTWMEVFAGGIGGLVARSRPGRDPDPYAMRAAFQNFTTQHADSELAGIRDYTAESTEGKVLVATDADVSVIAAHATRLALDTLLAREPSAFPYSMYVIGLMRSWLFQAPFDTIPIAADHLLGSQDSESLTDDGRKDNVEFLHRLLEK